MPDMGSPKTPEKNSFKESKKERQVLGTMEVKIKTNDVYFPDWGKLMTDEEYEQIKLKHKEKDITQIYFPYSRSEWFEANDKSGPWFENEHVEYTGSKDGIEVKLRLVGTTTHCDLKCPCGKMCEMYELATTSSAFIHELEGICDCGKNYWVGYHFDKEQEERNRAYRERKNKEK